MIPYFTSAFGNAASRNHSFGWQAEAAVDGAREEVARLLGSEKNEVIFTSGSTEGTNLALKGVAEMYASKGNHMITCTIEHKAVLDTCHYLEQKGAEVTYLKVSREGLIDLEELEAAIRPTTILIAIMWANNEIGTVMPVREIGAIARKHGVLFFTDATQAVGKIPVDVNSDNIDLLCLSAHKLYGPKGAGALYVRRRGPRVRLVPQMHGGGHERGLRSGTLNVPGIVGLGKACAIARAEMSAEAERLKGLRNRLESALLQLEETYVNGHREHRLPGTTNLSFKGVEDEALIMGFNKDIALSSGSACTSASLEPSYVLKALGLSDELARSSLRFGLGRFTTEAEVDYTIERVTRTVHQLREMSPLWQG
jgi:cysteine desulfurase